MIILLATDKIIMIIAATVLLMETDTFKINAQSAEMDQGELNSLAKNLEPVKLVL